MFSSKQRGDDSEDQAYQFLRNKGLKLVEKNFHSRFGEVDLVMLDNDELAFIEVRYRRNSNYGSGLESVTTNKQTKIIKTASVFLQQHAKLAKYPARFDIVSISGELTNAHIDWIKNAFET